MAVSALIRSRKRGTLDCAEEVPNHLIADPRLFFAESSLGSGLMSDGEWAFFAPFVVEREGGGAKLLTRPIAYVTGTPCGD